MESRARTINRLFRFGALGGVGFVVNLGLTAVLHELLGVSEEVAFAIALVVVFFGNYLSCRYLVFDGATGDGKRQLVHYAVASIGFRIAQYLSFLVLYWWVGIPYLTAIVLVLGAWFLIKFGYYRSAVFRPASR